MNPCEVCGAKAADCGLMNARSPTLFAGAPGECDVLIAVGAINPGDNPNPMYLARAKWIAQVLLSQGWTEEEVARRVAWTYSLRCPPVVNLSEKLVAHHKKQCGSITRRDILALRPKVVVLLDKTDWSSLAVTPKGKVDSRAIPLTLNVPDSDELFTTHVLSVLNPDNVAKNPDKNLPYVLEHDLRKIRAIIDEGTYPFNPFEGKNYRRTYSTEDAIAVLNWYADQPGVLAADIETAPEGGSLDPYSKIFKIIGVSLCAGPGTAVFVPLYHKDAGYEVTSELLAALQRVLIHQYLTMHNGEGFDSPAFRVNLKMIVNLWWCTMMADGLLDENRPHTLKLLAELFVPTLGHYEDTLERHFAEKGIKNDARDYERDVPIDMLTDYACADADATWQIQRYQQNMLPTLGDHMLDFFLTHTMPDARAAAKVTANGAVLNKAKRDAIAGTVEEDYQAAFDALQAHPATLKFIAQKYGELIGKGSRLTDGQFIYGGFDPATGQPNLPLFDLPNKKELVAGAGDELLKLRVLKKPSPHYTKKNTFTPAQLKFNPFSTAEIGKIVSGVLGLQSPKQTKSGDSWDAEVLRALEPNSDWISLLQKWRRLSKVLTTYIRPVVNGTYEHVTATGQKKSKIGWIKDDGLIHTRFMMTGADFGGTTAANARGGTRTGRKSSADPNLQNVEKHSKWGKFLYGLFESRFSNPKYPFAVNDKHAAILWEAMTPDQQAQVNHFVKPGEPGGGCILNVDFSQLELRIFAIVVGIRWMLDRYKDPDADLHGELAMDIFQKTRDEVRADHGLLRTAAKSYWFGPIYGQGAAALHKGTLQKGVMSQTYPGELITLQEVEAILSRLYAKMPEFEPWKAQLENTLQQTGCVYSLCGRRRLLPHYFSADNFTKAGAMRQAVNFEVQSPGADCTNDANIRTNFALEARSDLRSVVINNVHDSIVSDCPSEEVPEVFWMTKEIMETPRWPGLRRGEAEIELLAEGSMGPDWGDQIEIERASTHAQLLFDL